MFLLKKFRSFCFFAYLFCIVHIISLMFKFFDVSLALSAESGFARFGAGHIIWLGALIAFCALTAFIYRRASPTARRWLRLAVSGAAVIIEVWRGALFFFAGEYTLGRLPLHLCTMAVYLSFFHALRGGGFIAQLLYAFAMPGALAALICPDWSVYPMRSFLAASSFMLHILLVSYPLMLVFARELTPDIRQGAKMLGALLSVAVPVFFFDRLTDTNYMFLNYPAPASPLEWFAFLGRPWYILGYIPLLFTVWGIIYLPFIKRRGQ